MAQALYIPVKESIKYLKQQLRKSNTVTFPRLRMLIEMKKAGKSGITKRELMEKAGSCSQSIHTWRTNYKLGGLSSLLKHNRGGYKPNSFTPTELSKLDKLVHNTENNIVGYKELQRWVKKEFNKEIKYNTLLKFMVSHFKTKIKVARKVHVLTHIAANVV
ncbi:MAG: helix-turn-helix domain-containing protein [Bacteroidia bacterium]|nr:helix-turn-helix domain-containing protein [Bacteroidia bacterium]